MPSLFVAIQTSKAIHRILNQDDNRHYFMLNLLAGVKNVNCTKVGEYMDRPHFSCILVQIG